MSRLIHYKTVLAGLILAVMLGWGGGLAAQTMPVGFSLSGASVTEKDTFVVAINADSLLTGREVYAYRLYITYSPYYLEFLDTDGVSSLLSGWGTPVQNSSNEGTVILAGAGTAPLSGSGEMIYLKFRSRRPGNTTISYNTTESYLNERNPPSTFTSGYIAAAARSYPNIYPDQQQMFIGDEVQMTVSGGVAPYLYTTDDPLVAAITDGDRVRAVGPGTTRVRVTDENGEVSTTTGLFDVRAIRMDLEEVSAWPADTFYIPVKLQVAPGTTLFSGRFDLAFSGGLSGLPGDILPGDFPVVIENNAKNGRMTLSFASSSGITSNGVLCYLSFRANSSGNQTIRFENMRFNETLLAWTTKSTYYITVHSLPTLGISPWSGTLMWGEIQKINVSNGTAPYSYSVSDESVASIDLQGNLSAITGGAVHVTATDLNGATRTSGLFTINDHQVSIFSTDGMLDSETRVPIITSSLPTGKAVYGFSAGFSFDETYLEFVRAEAVSGGLIQSSQTGSSIQVAGASGEGVSSGLMGFLVFQIKNTLALDQTTNIVFNSFSANENSLHSLLEDGHIRRVEQTSYRPVAIAGLDFALQEGSTGHLDGTASFDLDNDPLTYLWRAPEGFVLVDSTSATPEFLAPYVSENSLFTFQLIVNDGTDDSDPSEVNVTVLQVNFGPVADAGADRNLVEGSSVSLDGSSSFDPDGDAISYDWSSLDGIVLFNAASVSPSFILPQVAANTTYRFSLVVNDGAVSSTADIVSITAIQVNKKPVAFAGGDFSLDEKAQGSLDGSLSYDADNDPLSYQWTAPAGVTLSSSTVANPGFTAPAVHRDSVLEFVLVVNDGSKDSDPDVVLATIINLDSLSMEALIDSVFMTALDSFAIDTAGKTVTLYLPYGSDIHSLSPGFTLSKAASIHPASGSSHDFSMPVYYTVTAEDGVTNRLWRVEVFRPQSVVQRTLNAGWNWISLNVQPAEMEISALFNGLTLNDLDYLKSTAYSATYYDATGWFGDLSVFPQNRMVKFRKNSAENLVIQGLEVNPAMTPLPLVRGWNDIAYLLRSDQPVSQAIEATSVPSDGALLKGLEGSAIYYAGSGWVGELETMKPLHGYKILVESAGNLMYDPSGATRKSSSPEINSHQQLLQAYRLSPENFEYSATLIAEVLSGNGKQAIGPGDLIMAFHGDEIRGVSGSRYIPSLERHLFILTYYSNEEDQEITYKVKLSSGQREYLSDLSVNFRPDRITGEAYHPWKIVLNDLNLSHEDIRSDRLSVYPNPVSDQLTITSSTPVIKISLYDITGKKILGGVRAGKTITISMQQFVPGVYTLEAETANEVIVRKIVRTSY